MLGEDEGGGVALGGEAGSLPQHRAGSQAEHRDCVNI